MKIVSTLAMIAVLAAGAVHASPKNDSPTLPTAAMGLPCDLTGYKVSSMVLTPAFAIPDNNGGDSLVTTLAVPDDSTEFLNVIAAVKIGHTFVGDLVLRLEYFADCGAPAVTSFVNLLCRPRGAQIAPPAPCGAGPVDDNGSGSNIGTSANNSTNLPGLYFFSDDAPTRIADGTSPALTPAGCYLPSSGAMSAFVGQRKGGCFKLICADYAGADLGSIEELHVYSMNSQNVPTRMASWGAIKSIYR